MLVFDPHDPYPLPTEGLSYAEAQEHARQVDEWLGFEIAPIEASLNKQDYAPEQNPWIGLPPKALQTPYTELREILSRLDLKAGDHVVDLGAGYGRMAFVLNAHHAGVRFTGLELVRGRVSEGQRVFQKHALPGTLRLLEHDLAAPSPEFPAADHYFIYDFGAREAIEKTLHDLRESSFERKIQVVGRGRSVRDAIERRHPWLSDVFAPVHFAHYSLYRSS